MKLNEGRIKKEEKTIEAIAREIVDGNRSVDYGGPAQSLDKMAKINALLNLRADNPYDLAIIFKIQKIVRNSYKHKRDNLVDEIGYTIIQDDIIEKAGKYTDDTLKNSITPLRHQFIVSNKINNSFEFTYKKIH